MERAFEQQLVIAHEIAVVAGEYDNGVLVESERFEPTQNAADGIVDHRDHAVGQRDRFTRFTGGDCKSALAVAVAFVLRALVVERLQVRRNRPLARMERWWQRDCSRIVHVPIASRRRKWMVRVGKRALDEKRVRAIGA